MLCILPLLLNIVLVRAADLYVVGQIRLGSPSLQPTFHNGSLRNLASRRVQQGTVILYNFFVNVTFEDSAHVQDLSLRISVGDHILKNDSHVYLSLPNTPKIELSSKEQNDSMILVYIQRNGISFLIITGNYSIITKGNTSGPIRSILQLQPNTETPQKPETVTIFSETVVQEYPEYNLSSPQPNTLHLKNKTTVLVNVTYPSRIVQDSYLKLYMPKACDGCDGCDGCEDVEAQMTVISFDSVKPSALHGKVYYLSDTKTSESDAAIFFIDNYRKEAGPGWTGFMAISELLDYRKFQHGDIIEEAVGYKFKDEFIWIGTTNITVADDRNLNIPNIEMLVSEFSNYEKFGEVTRRLRMALDHSLDSTGSAYDIMAILYFPPELDFVKSTHYLQNVVKKPETPIDIKKNKVIFNILRMSFVHSSKIYFNVSCNVNSSALEGEKYFRIVYEMVYRGWNDTKDRSTPLQTLTFVEGEPKKEEKLVCPCPWNATQKCVCCKPGQCLCFQTKDPEVCGPCQKPCACASEIIGYRNSSRLSYRGVTITCGDLEPAGRYSRHRVIGCRKMIQGQNNPVYLPTMVSTVLGLDMKTKHLYGITNNGKGYVLSEDDGQSWVSIPHNNFIEIQASTTFLPAHFM